MATEEVSFIQERKYQTHLLEILKDISNSNLKPSSCLIELDCGMGKRILSYLMVEKYFPNKKTLILLQASSSLQETADFFLNRYKVNVGVLSSRVPSQWRSKILKEHRIILATPQTLANVLQKIPDEDYGIELLIVNEVDKIIRRTATRRTLVYPYPFLLERFNKAWMVGLSGTLRDNHVIVSDQIRIISELQTLAENLPGVRIITMEEIMAGDENFEKHIIYTHLESYAVNDKPIHEFFEQLDHLIKDYRRRILDEALAEGLIEPGQKNLALIAGQLPVDSVLSGKYNALLMLRKYLTGMLPVKYKRFVQRFPEFQRAVDFLPDRSSRLQVIPKIIEEHFKTTSIHKVVVMVTYVYTGDILKKYLTKAGFDTYMISGMVKDKASVINQFRGSKALKTVLIMTQVGERDLDIPEAKLIIVYDTINTTKTMYQRFKRTRGGKVVCLYYEGTSEENKIKRLFKGIQEKYPWSVKIADKYIR